MSDSSDFDATAIPGIANKIGQAWKENGNTSPTPKNLGSTKSGKYIFLKPTQVSYTIKWVGPKHADDADGVDDAGDAYM